MSSMTCQVISGVRLPPATHERGIRVSRPAPGWANKGGSLDRSLDDPEGVG